ncbi:GNAT family N-acetyltransferase [Gordonia shandongensis]|uniref:GNAT family N-acetyltransferase n=1 Tax=Gordonia shandongensis TaxID=376351 RepID=UPI0006860FDA|nr:GNAT family N-acetyltransferase [Gordonia shandongensis]
MDDGPVVCEATLLNFNWSRDRFTSDDVERRPELRRYTRFVPGRGDFGFVVDGPEGWQAVVWVLMLPADDPGYGFVAPGIGELSVCCAPDSRRRGLGGRLVSVALDHAARAGHHGVSLSVEKGNPARRLYERLGFVDVDGRPGTMLATVVAP